MNCPSFEDLVLYSEGDSATQRLNVHVPTCGRCQALLSEIKAMTDALRDDRPGEADEDLIQTIMKETQRERKPKIWFVSLVAVAAAAALAVILPRPMEKEQAFTPRGEESLNSDRWVSIEVYGERNGKELVPIKSPLAPHERLAFSYTRKPEEPYRYLMILGLGAQGQVYWYYPAYTEAGSNPCSISLAAEQRDALLPDQIEHALAPGPLRIFAVFSIRPYCVQEIEAQIAQEHLTAAQAPDRLNWPDTAQHSLDFRVEADLEIKD